MIKKVDFDGREFVVSSFSGTNHSCIGVSIGKNDVGVINTNTLDKAVYFTHDEWRAFLHGVKNNEFELK